MVSLAGLSAAYPGFLDAQSTDENNKLKALQIQAAQTDLAGQQAYGRTLATFTGGPAIGPMLPGGAMPMPPQPGQPSIPMRPPGMQGAAPMPMPFGVQGPSGMQGMPQQPPGVQQGQPMPQQGGGMPQGQLDWATIAKRVAAANPGARPEVIAAAVDRFMPLMNQQSQMQWKELSMMMRQQTLDLQEQRLKQQGDQFQQRETRLSGQAAIRNDQRFQDLDLRKQNFERQIIQGNDRNSLGQWRAIVDAQHKRATEIIQANSQFSNLGSLSAPKETLYKDGKVVTDDQGNPVQVDAKTKLLEEENERYEEEIRVMRDRMDSGGAPAPSKHSFDHIYAPSVGTDTGDAGGTMFKGIPAGDTTPVKNKDTSQLDSEEGVQLKPVTPDVKAQLDDAIKMGKDKNALIARLKKLGYDTSGL